jgi:hypothetical protein
MTAMNLMEVTKKQGEKIKSNQFTDEQLLTMGLTFLAGAAAARKESKEEALCNLLCAGLESGPYGSVRIVEYIEPPALNFRTDEKKQHVFRHLDYPMNEGGAIMVVDKYEDDDGVEDLYHYRLDKPALLRGLARMYIDCPSHGSDFMKGNEDALTGDTLVQCAVFGTPVYG